MSRKSNGLCSRLLYIFLMIMCICMLVACKKDDNGGVVVLPTTPTEPVSSEANDTTTSTEVTEPVSETETVVDDTTNDTESQASTEPTSQEPTQVVTEPVTQYVPAVGPVIPSDYPDKKPWDLINDEVLNPRKSGYDELDRLIEGFIRKLYNDGVLNDEMSQYQYLRAIYVWYIQHITYNRGMNVDAGKYSTSSIDNTPEEVLWATDLLNTYQGCCYNYSASFMYIMRYLGYDAHLLSGQVGSYNGGVTPHCWLYVNLDGRPYTLDPDVDSNYYWRDLKNESPEPRTDVLFCRKMSDMTSFYIIEKEHTNLD